jgi:hypothetical protein
MLVQGDAVGRLAQQRRAIQKWTAYSATATLSSCRPLQISRRFSPPRQESNRLVDF